MKKLIKKFKFSKNKKNIAKITSGTMLGQIISLITLPILTRLYGAEIFGTWALITAIAMIIASYSDLGMSNLLMIESKKRLLKSYRVISTLSLLLSLISSLIISCFYNLFFENIQIPSYLFFIFLFFTSFLSQQIQICYTWLNRVEEYNVLMKNPLINYSVYGIGGIIFGLLGFIQYGFFIAHLLGSIVTLINMKKKLPKGMLTFSFKEVYNYLKENRKFAFYQMPTNVSNNLKSQTPTILINFFWGIEILGYYSITVRILKMPVILIAKSIGRVFFQVISGMKRQGTNLGDYVIKNVIKAMKISIIPITCLVGFGDVITILFLGEEWEIAGDFVRILALQYFFLFLQNSMQGLAIVLDKQKYALIANATQIVGLIISILIGKYLFDSIYLALAIAAIVTILIQIIYFSSLFKVMNVSIFFYIKNIVISVSIILMSAIFLREFFNYIL